MVLYVVTCYTSNGLFFKVYDIKGVKNQGILISYILPFGSGSFGLGSTWKCQRGECNRGLLIIGIRNRDTHC